MVDVRLKLTCDKRGSLRLRIVSTGMKMRESDGSTDMREKIWRSPWKTKGAAERMRASGRLSVACGAAAEAVAAKRTKKLAASARAPGIECERCMAR
ncbi:hypothetical protein [Caballeronia sp. AZ1_KS37]|uniref:hypothetical protein n=1 Tax=Caballeronia sp. AZ1_KS37 TaxID=2921756 RepID=UPI0020282ECC|nr:hypothetical protein [Caballeronia sp. AZ1_KS37]